MLKLFSSVEKIAKVSRFDSFGEVCMWAEVVLDKTQHMKIYC